MGNDNKQQYSTSYYNLDMIISIGFRVNSKPAIKFRSWANKIIKDYIKLNIKKKNIIFLYLILRKKDYYHVQ